MSAFITEWNMPAGNFTLPLRSGYIYDMVVDWGDGSPTSNVTVYNDANAIHNYAVAGTYQISITGTCGAWYINNNPVIDTLITKIIQWGDVGFASKGLSFAFEGCTNLTSLPDGPITGATSITEVESTFAYSGITTIPIGFFDYCPLIKEFKRTFQHCEWLETVPDGLLISSAISGVYALYYTFYNCYRLILNPYIFYLEGQQNTRFLNKSIGFNSCFRRTYYYNTEKGEAPDLWNCDFGTGSPQYYNTTFSGNGNSLENITNYCEIPTEWGATTCPKLWSFIYEKTSILGELRLIATTSVTKPASDELKIYISETEMDLFNMSNLLSINSVSDTIFSSETIWPDHSNFYAGVEYYVDGVLSESLTLNDFFKWVEQVDTEIINITNPNNYVVLNNPQHPRNHGLIFYNNFLYGSARGTATSESSVFKLNAADYSILLQTKIFLNKNTETNLLRNFDQIIQCSGFLWISVGSYLVRINPLDLDYIIFDNLPLSSLQPPICTDGIYLYHTDDINVKKINTSLLIDTFQSYGYTGDSPVNIPPLSIVGSCQVIQYHPTYKAYLHSIVVDSNYLYCAFTSTSFTAVINGFADDIYFFHMQKINKSTMQTVGDVIIPKCTDDMVQNGEYVFLAPEYQSGASLDLLGANWGLLAINKKNLEIKFLKDLHSDTLGWDVEYRQCYGVFYFNNKIAVLQSGTKRTIIIDITDVEHWGKNFPIGGATDAIYRFQINGVFLSASNELVLDNSGWVHMNTWEENTIVFKFTLDELTDAEKNPNIQTTLISSSSNNATIGGYVIDEGQSPITDVGFRYGTDPELLSINVDVSPDTYDFQTLLESLDPGIYYIQAWGTNTEGTFYGNTVVFSTFNVLTLAYNSASALLEWINENYGCSIRCVQDAPGVADGTTGTATDQDGNQYNTVVINGKRWLVENLRTTHFRNGDPVPNVIPAVDWAALEAENDPAYCEYDEAENPAPEAEYLTVVEVGAAETVKTIVEVNALSPEPGTGILFNRGETFEGTITPANSGTVENPIVYGAFGTGPAPKIYASEIVTGWTLHSGNIYKALATGAINQLFANNTRMKAARWPETGYANIDVVNSVTSFTCNALNDSIDYTGAICLVKTNPYSIIAVPVISSTGKTLTLDDEPYGGLDVNGGFILMNKLEFLTEAGSWYFDASANFIYFRTPGDDTPENYQIRASVENSNVHISLLSNIEVKNMELDGAKTRGIYLSSSGLMVADVNILNPDETGVEIPHSASNTEVKNSVINGANHVAIKANGDNFVIADNQLLNTALLENLNLSGCGQFYHGAAIYSEGDNGQILRNRITDTGYNAICFYGACTVEKNVIKNACLTKTDGGAIYTYANSQYPNARNQGSIIRNNIIDNVPGTLDGWQIWGPLYLAYGIYCDNRTAETLVEGNIIKKAGGAGIFLHDNTNTTVQNNVIFDCPRGFQATEEFAATGNIFQNNIVCNIENTPDYGYDSPHLMSIHSDYLGVVSINNNVYIDRHRTHPFRDSKTNTYLTFAEWKALTGYDADSVYINTPLEAGETEELFYNDTETAKTYSLNGATAKQYDGTPIVDGFTLQPFTSIIIHGLNLNNITED